MKSDASAPALSREANIALFLGAGFSKWSCDLPLVAELFDFAVHVDNAIEEKRLTRLQNIYNEWRSAHPKDHPEVFVRYAQGAPGFNLVNWYITRRLTEPFIVTSGRRYTWYINSYHSQQHAGVAKARKFLELLSSLARIDIITTNYDMVPEYALGTRNFNYGVIGEQIGFTPYPYPRPVYVKGDLSIAKLHGSISWDASKKFPDLRCGLTGKCLIVPPVTEKRPPPLLQKQWSFARRNLKSCDVLLIFGFSFNENDQAIRRFITRNLNGKAEVVFIDLVDHRNRLSSIFDDRELAYVDALDARMQKRVQAVLKRANKRAASAQAR